LSNKPSALKTAVWTMTEKLKSLKALVSFMVWQLGKRLFS
jgi:hypothetical protein